MRIVFMGTPDFAVPVLSEIVGWGHEVVAVYTRAPRAAGRGMELRRSAVHVAAENFGLTVLHPASLRDETIQAEFAAHQADVAIVVAYGLLLPKVILDLPRHGCFNLHASLLPRWRGAAPIQRAIMAGDQETAASVMRMEEGLDTGPLAMVEKVRIGPDMTAAQLRDQLAVIGADLMVRALSALTRGSLQLQPQSARGVTYAKKIEKSEAQINFRADAAQVHNLIRGLSPFPGAFFEADFGHGIERVKVFQAEVADLQGKANEVLQAGLIGCHLGAIRCLKLQRAGKSALSLPEFNRGVHWPQTIGR